MSQNQSKQPSVAELLEMSRTQIVAEAFLLDEDRNPKYLHPNKEKNEYTFKDVALVQKILKEGNNHTSKLTEPQIKEFMENWKVVAYLPNTTTGFSGTLFKAKRDIPGTTIKAGEKVMSLRSTEFIDDAVRDNQATNKMEIADRGWAFGQIDDLEQWFQGLRNEKLIGDGEQIRITGYSLGGHLATAFNILHRDEGLIKNTYTFNGAGVGRKTKEEEMDKETLKNIIHQFHETRYNGINSTRYNNNFLVHYNKLTDILEQISHADDSKIDEIESSLRAYIYAMTTHAIPADDDVKEILNNITKIIDENRRVRSLSSGTEQKAKIVNYSDIAALGLNYQIALKEATQRAYAYPKLTGLETTILNERLYSNNRIENLYEIYAKNPPSMVASSQLHYGTEIPISVENQPLGRGDRYTYDVVNSLFEKLLVNNYNYNDFGDTHSIALLNDSLESMDVLNKLNQQDDINIWDSLIKLSSNKKTLMDEKLSDTPWWVDMEKAIASIYTPNSIKHIVKREAHKKMREWDMDWVKDSPKNQGYADGDAIESLVNALAKTFGVDSDLKGDPNGNTWYLTESHEGKDENGETHTFSGRTDLHSKLREISKKIESYNLGNDVELKPMDTAFTSTLNTAMVRENFGYLVSLYTLSPFSLVSKGNSTALDKVWTDNWNELYQQWKDDKAAYDKGQAATHFSDEWINDRIQLLTTKSFLNFYNIDYDSDSENFVRDVYLAAIDDSKGIEEFDKLSKAEKVHYAHEALKKRFPYLGNFELTSVDDNIHIALYKMLEDKESLGKIVFGSEKDTKPLIGSDKDDHLYGTGENDVLIGGKGNDYMEGGSGFDTYHIEGHDTVFDADSKGELIFGKDKVAYFIPATSNSQNSWISSNSSGEADNKFRAAREGNHLLITSVADEANKVTIRDYFSGRNTLDGTLGLNVVKPINDEGNAKEYTITPNSNNVHNEYHLGPYSYAVNGNPLNDLIFAASSRQGKTGLGLLTNTGAGNDVVFGSFYPDVIEGGADTDILSGSNHPGKLTEAQKALDNDIIAGNDGSDFIFGKAGNDILHGGNAEEYLSEDTLEGQGDWINGGEGSDKLYGSRAQDVLQGGAGSDELYGGAGNDLIVGDSDHEVKAHVMRRFEENYYPLTHIHRYNRDKDEFDPIERMKLRQKLDEESAKWTLKIDSKTQNYSISRNYSDWDNKGTYLAADKGGAADYLEGGAGNDMLIGQRGDDTLYGQSGDDILFGDDNHDKSIVGNDHLRGGSGSDTLIGGKGADKYYFFRDELKAEAGESAPIDTIIDDGRGEGNQLDEIYLDGYPITAFEWNFDKIAQRWAHASGWQIIKNGNMLNISHKDEAGRIVVKDYADGDYGLRLSENDNKPSPEPVNPEPPKPEQPKPEQPKAPTAGKPLTAQSIHEKQRLAYTLAEDAFHTATQDDKLAYSARLADGKPLPRWLSFNAATRTFSGTPGNDDVGMLNIEVSAKGKGGSASQRLTLNVINVNDAPQIGAAIANHTSESGKPLQYRLPANAFKDIDKGDVLTLSAKLENGQPLPSWLSFDGKTGQFSGTPPSSRTANNYRIAVTATDKGGLSARQNFTLSTKPAANQPPRVAINLPVQKMNEKSRWQYTIPANAFHDADGDSLSYSATQADGKSLPKWLNFNAANRTFSGTPGNDDVGNLALRITASDNRGGVASQNLALQIANVNDAPQIGATIANHTSESGKPLQYRLPVNAFKDIDKGDVLTLSAKLENGQPLPSWLSFDEKTGQFSGTPPSSRTANNYRIAVTATDKAGAQVSQKFSLMTAAGAVNIIRGTGKESSIQGTSGNDTIYVGDNPLQGWRYKEVYGSDGDDVIYSGSGRDAIYGGAGNDILYTNGTEHDSLYGGYGDDIYRLGADFRSVSIENFDLKQYDWRPQRRDVIEFTAHKRDYFNIYRTGDNLYLQGRDGQKVSIFYQFSNHGNNQHYINEFRFTDKILTAADIKALLNNGTPGNDTLYAKPEGSRLYSGDGNDRIFGNQGNDYLYGEAGNDTIYGRAGDDYLWGEIGNDLLYGGTGKDMLNGGLGDDQLYGDADDDRLFGDKGNDLLYGGEGNDKLDGSLDDDWLFGEAGNDELFGSTGNDVLNGGSGNDQLIGHEGNDIYQFQSDFGEDIIQNRSNPAMLAGSQYDRIDFLDLKPDDLYFRKIGDNLVIISKKRAQNRVTVLEHFRDNGNTAARIDEIRFVDGTKLDYAAINRLVQKNSSGNAASADSVRRGNLFASDAAHQAQQINQAIAALNGQAQPLDALAMPDLQPRPLLAAGNT